MKFKSVLYILSACLVICMVSGHIHLSHHRKLEIAKKIGAALFFASKKRMMLPLPVPLPVPIPIFKSYQPIISDPYFFKHQIIAQKFGKLGGLGFGGYGGGIGGFGGIGGGGGGFGR